MRVLIGSTQKMGTGTNVQKRLVALHHLDAPWKPAEVEQRDGRILRQGNQNEEVAIYRYVTEGSFDAYMWQALETKAQVYQPGHDRRQRRPPCRGHRQPGTLLCRGQGDCLRQPGRAHARRGRRRTATPQSPEKEPPGRAIRRPPQRSRSAGHYRKAQRKIVKAHRRRGDGNGPCRRSGHHRQTRLVTKGCPHCNGRPARPPCPATSAKQPACRLASTVACGSA